MLTIYFSNKEKNDFESCSRIINIFLILNLVLALQTLNDLPRLESAMLSSKNYYDPALEEVRSHTAMKYYESMVRKNLQVEHPFHR